VKRRTPLPPRPAEIGCDSVMSQADALSPWSQRSLVWYRDDDRVVMGVLWREKDERGRISYHLINTATNGQVEYRVLAADQARYFTDARVLATPQQFEDYLRGRLTKFGAVTRAVYKALGVEPPQQETAPANDDAAYRLSELYQRAARLLEVPEPELRKKYGHLNPGLQAMNLRNRLRAKGHNV
jgi:hypothetical protein